MNGSKILIVNEATLVQLFESYQTLFRMLGMFMVGVNSVGVCALTMMMSDRVDPVLVLFAIFFATLSIVMLFLMVYMKRAMTQIEESLLGREMR